MKYNYEFDMKYTDNPYIDIIVQCVKILGMNAVVKNENQALHYEDVRSAKYATDYITFKEGDWDEQKKGAYWEEKYFEWNSYYRMLYGLPPMYTLNDEKAYLDATGYGDEIYEDIGNAWVIPELYKRYFIDMGQYTLPEEMSNVLDLTGRYLHELSLEELSMIESCGIMKQILSEYGEDPHYQYIYHLGDKRIDYYTARKAVNFSLLWIPSLNTFDIIENKFKRVFDRNRRYTMATVYSEAYRFMSYHYDAFIEILIIIQTMVDMISEVQEYIINKDVFDSRTIRYLFESYGIAYYKEIPVKYQIRIIKNVNTLLKYKSSHRNIIDILELFDDDTITIYTYYLMKTKKLHRDNFFFYTEDDVNPKYGTERDYWIGPKSDISNNKVPLTNVKYNVDEPEFIQQCVYNYELIDKDEKDETKNRKLTEEQVVASMIARPLTSFTVLQPVNSFIDTFMRNETVNWFDITEYNSDTQGSEYLRKRNDYLTGFGEAIAERIKKYFDNLCVDENNFALNSYNYRRIKYELYSILGVFDANILASENFNTMTDAELEQYFYQADTLITDAYATKHNILKNSGYNTLEDYRENSPDRFILNHSIPYMTYFDYKLEDTEIYEDVDNHIQAYVFQNNNSFTIIPQLYPDNYDKWTKLFRETYLIAVRSYIEGIFTDYEIDEVNNPTPQYIGWIDLNYVVSQLGKGISEFEIGDKVTTIGHNNIPIYTSSYIYEIITKDMVGQEFYRKNYDLCFLKVPILDSNAYKMLERYDMRRNYDMITLADPFWDGVSTFDILTEAEREKLHQSKKQEILSKDFTIERTKYIGVEASIDLTKMSYQICYFMNMLYDKYRDEEALILDVDQELVSSGRARLNDMLTFAIALNYLYQGVEPDNIASDMEKNMYINGFNFDNDWNDIYNYLENQHHIYNNYLNDPIKTYTYKDEFDEEHTVENGYGIDPLQQGWKTELYENFIVYDFGKDIKTYLGLPIYDSTTGKPTNKRSLKNSDNTPNNVRIGAFLSGRYKQCADDCITTAKFDLDFGASDIWNYNLCNAVKYDWSTGEFSTFDISWKPTQYPNDDNNSHGLWLSTDILRVMNANVSDLERFEMLKKIYYSNTNLYDHLTYMMRTAQSKRMYDIYKVVYDSYMETKMNHDFYKLINTNGSAIYTDNNNENSTYYIIDRTYYIKDNEGFPVYELVDSITGDTKKYYFSHNADFTNCSYISEDGTDIVECKYIKSKLIRENKKEYYVSNDLPEEFPRGFMFPDNIYEEQDKNFVMAEQHYYMLQNIKNPRILIPITIDPKSNPIKMIDVIEGDTTFVENGVEGNINVTKNEDGSVTVIITHPDYIEPIELTVNIEWKIASDYYEYMQYRNIELYNHLIDIKYNYNNVYDPVKQAYVPSDEKRQRIEALCEMIVMALEKYFDRNEWRYIFNLIPTANIQNIQNYIMKMVIFFKSWKTQILDTAVTYVLDDPYNNHVQILDDMYYNTTFDNLLEKVRPKEYKYFHNYTEYRDSIKIGEKVDFEVVNFEPYWATFGFGEKIYGHRFDYPVFNSNLNYRDAIGVSEKIEINTVEYTGEVTQDSNGNYLFP